MFAHHATVGEGRRRGCWPCTHDGRCTHDARVLTMDDVLMMGGVLMMGDVVTVVRTAGSCTPLSLLDC